MAKFNHAYDFAVEVISDEEDGSDVTADMLIAALRARIKRIEATNGGAEILQACNLYDSHECEGEDATAPVGSAPSRP